MSIVLRFLRSQALAVIVFTIVFLLLWQWYGNQPETFSIPPATEVFTQLREALTSGEVYGYIWGTLSIAFIGYAIAVVVGVASGTAIARSQVARNTIDPIVSALNSAPISALLPVVTLWFGLGKAGNVFIVFMFAVFVIIINTAAGVRQVPPEFIEAGRSFGTDRKPLALYQHILLPGAAPLIFNGVRLGIGRAITGAIFADLLLRVDNFGEFLLRAGSTFNMALLLAGVLITTIIGFLALQLTHLVERLVLPWNRERSRL